MVPGVTPDFPAVDVVGIGENSIDTVYRVPSYPQPDGASSKVQITSRDVLPGGQVATTLSTCAALGLSTRYVGAFGSDEHGTRIRQELERRGIDLASAVIRPVANRYAVIVIDQRSGERVVLWHRDPALTLRPDERGAGVLGGARLLHVDAVEEEAAIAAARLARAAGLQVTSDIDQVTARTSELVAAVTVPIFAEHVAAALTGERTLEAALRALRRSHDGLLCVTLGARGAVMLAGDALVQAPGYRIEAVDTTGAGDVFRGAFIYALLRGDAPFEMLRFANAAAAVSCTRQGAIGGVPARAEIDALMMRSA